MSPIVDVNEAIQVADGTVLAVPSESHVVIGPLGERYVRTNADGYLTAVDEDYYDNALSGLVDSDGEDLFIKDTNIDERSYIYKPYVAGSYGDIGGELYFNNPLSWVNFSHGEVIFGGKSPVVASNGELVIY